ncbi:helix-turn-helix domain-containing protein [Gammaproteobacteria bacterium]|nr:helix-turn-helix domain-containing protein [Gammaproteobacteria bacterium]
MQNIAHIIRSARKAKGMTQRELGQKVGIPQSHVSQIESGHIDIRLSSLQEIIKLLDLELMFVPRHFKPVIQGIIDGKQGVSQKPAWQADEEEV